METFYEVPDGVARIYDEVVEGQDGGVKKLENQRDDGGVKNSKNQGDDGGVKNLKNQKDITTKDYVMEDLQDGAWCLGQARSESEKSEFKNVETRKDNVNKVRI